MIKRFKRILYWWIKTKCFSCGSEIQFITTGNTGIFVNIESKGKINIPNFWIISNCCSNPLCKWSQIKEEVHAMNLCDCDKGWKIMEGIKNDY